jgi:hypothetical protein
MIDESTQTVGDAFTRHIDPLEQFISPPQVPDYHNYNPYYQNYVRERGHHEDENSFGAGGLDGVDLRPSREVGLGIEEDIDGRSVKEMEQQARLKTSKSQIRESLKDYKSNSTSIYNNSSNNSNNSKKIQPQKSSSTTFTPAPTTTATKPIEVQIPSSPSQTKKQNQARPPSLSYVIPVSPPPSTRNPRQRDNARQSAPSASSAKKKPTTLRNPPFQHSFQKRVEQETGTIKAHLYAHEREKVYDTPHNNIDFNYRHQYQHQDLHPKVVVGSMGSAIPSSTNKLSGISRQMHQPVVGGDDGGGLRGSSSKMMMSGRSGSGLMVVEGGKGKLPYPYLRARSRENSATSKTSKTSTKFSKINVGVEGGKGPGGRGGGMDDREQEEEEETPKKRIVDIAFEFLNSKVMYALDLSVLRDEEEEDEDEKTQRGGEEVGAHSADGAGQYERNTLQKNEEEFDRGVDYGGLESENVGIGDHTTTDFQQVDTNFGIGEDRRHAKEEEEAEELDDSDDMDDEETKELLKRLEQLRGPE